jgi:hypothetical protein
MSRDLSGSTCPCRWLIALEIPSLRILARVRGRISPARGGAYRGEYIAAQNRQLRGTGNPGVKIFYEAPRRSNPRLLSPA